MRKRAWCAQRSMANSFPSVSEHTWIFWRARFSAAEPPCARNWGFTPVTKENRLRTAVTSVSMFKSVW